MHFVLVYKHLMQVPNPTKPCAQILIGLGTRFWHGFLVQSNTLYMCIYIYTVPDQFSYIYIYILIVFCSILQDSGTFKQRGTQKGSCAIDVTMHTPCPKHGCDTRGCDFYTSKTGIPGSPLSGICVKTVCVRRQTHLREQSPATHTHTHMLHARQ